MAMRYQFKFDIGDEVVTRTGDRGIVVMLGIGTASEHLCSVQVQSGATFWNPEEWLTLVQEKSD